jgi:hypothetical protein
VPVVEVAHQARHIGDPSPGHESDHRGIAVDLTLINFDEPYVSLHVMGSEDYATS